MRRLTWIVNFLLIAGAAAESPVFQPATTARRLAVAAAKLATEPSGAARPAALAEGMSAVAELAGQEAEGGGLSGAVRHAREALLMGDALAGLLGTVTEESPETDAGWESALREAGAAFGKIRSMIPRLSEAEQEDVTAAVEAVEGRLRPIQEALENRRSKRGGADEPVPPTRDRPAKEKPSREERPSEEKPPEEPPSEDDPDRGEPGH